MWFTYCEMLPGKIAMKNAAVRKPTWVRYFQSRSRDKPSAISTAPDAITTKSGESGTQFGTWAWNSWRLVVKCKVPV